MDNIQVVFQHNDYAELLLAYTLTESSELRLIQCIKGNSIQLYRFEQNTFILRNGKVHPLHNNTAYYTLNDAIRAYEQAREA